MARTPPKTKRTERTKLTSKPQTLGDTLTKINTSLVDRMPEDFKRMHRKRKGKK